MKSESVNERRMGEFAIVKYTGDTEGDVRRLSVAYITGLLQGMVKKVALDMEDVTRFYSISIGHLVNLLNAVEGKSGHLYLINVPEIVTRALSSVNLLPKFQVYPSEYDFVIDQGLEGAYGGEGGNEPITTTTSFKAIREMAGNRAVIKIEGALIDGEGRKALWEETRAALTPGVREVVLDLEAAEFIDSVALGELVALHRLCAEKGVALKAVNAGEVVADAFKVTGLARQFGLE